MKKGLIALIGIMLIGVLPIALASESPSGEVQTQGQWIGSEEPQNLSMAPDERWMDYATSGWTGWGYRQDRAIRMYPADFGVSYPFTITRLRAHLVYYGWCPNRSFRFHIYADNGSTELYSSPWMNANYGWSYNYHDLSSPVTISSGTFWISVEPYSSYTPYQTANYSSSRSSNHSYYGYPGSWHHIYYRYEWVMGAYVQWSVGETDIEVVDIDTPPEFITSGYTYTPEGTIKNNGAATSDNITVACSIWTSAGTLEYHSEKTIFGLGTGAEVQAIFDPWTPTSYCGDEYTVKISTDYDDPYPENNSKEKSCLVVRVLLAQWDFNDDPTFEHSSLSGCTDDWQWGTPGTSYGGPSSAHSPPNCWGTILNGHYHNRAGGRILSPVVELPSGSKKLRLRFYHYYYTESYWDGGNVKVSKDGGDFELAYPMGGYPYGALSTSACAVGGQPGYCGSARSWREAIVDFPLDTPVNEIQAAWDFGSDYSVNRYCGWYIDDVRVSVTYPPVAITDIGGIPAIAGINCCYTPTAKVKNQWRTDLVGIDIQRHIGIPGDAAPQYSDHRIIRELAKDAETEVSFENWCAPSEPGITFYDSLFVGIGGRYLDTVFRYFVTGVDVGDHEPLEPMDTIYTDTGYYPMVTLKALIGCDVPTHASLILQDSTAHAVYYSEQDIILPHGSKEYTFDSLSVEEPGYYTFVLFTETVGDSNFKNDTLRWDVRALTRGVRLMWEQRLSLCLLLQALGTL